METPPSGIPSPPLSPQGSPSSLASDFPSLSESLYSFLAPDSPCPDYEYSSSDEALGFSSHEHSDPSLDLVLPSLTIHQRAEPSSLGAPVSRSNHVTLQPPLSGQSTATGNVKILVAGKHGAGKSLVCDSLVAGAPEVLEVHPWELQSDGSKTLHASTAERGQMNLKLAKACGWDETAEPLMVVEALLDFVREPFEQASELLSDSATIDMAELSSDLLASPATCLYTVAVVVLSSTPTALETRLVRALSQHLPTIPFSPHRIRRRAYSPSEPHSRSHSRPPPFSRPLSRYHSRPVSPHRHTRQLHSRAPSIPTHLEQLGQTQSHDHFHPTSHRALREWIFDGKNLQRLRRDAAEKFLAWRKRERGLTHFQDDTQIPVLEDDPFQRFTFDLLFPDGATSDEEDQENAELGLSTAITATQEDIVTKPNLTRLVLSRKRPIVEDRQDTVKAWQPSNVRMPLSSVVEALSQGSEDPHTPTDTAPQEGIASLATSISTPSTADQPQEHVDPLHLPSIFSLALSILPDLKWRLIAGVRGLFSGLSDEENMEAGTLEKSDYSEKAACTTPSSNSSHDRTSRKLFNSKSRTAVMVALAAALGFWAGFVIGDGQRDHGTASAGSSAILSHIAKVRNLL